MIERGRRIKDAYIAGATGDPRRDEGLFARTAYRLGRIEAAYFAKEKQQRLEGYDRMLGHLEKISQGSNKTALQIIRLTGTFPQENQSEPTEGFQFEEKGIRKHNWHVSFRSPGIEQKPDTIATTPLNRHLGRFTVTGNSWDKSSTDGVDIYRNTPVDVDLQVDKVLLQCRAEYLNGRLEPATTSVQINDDLMIDFESPLPDDPSVNNLQFTVDEEGITTNLSLGYKNGTSSFDMNPKHLTMDPANLLIRLLNNVQETAKTFQELKEFTTEGFSENP